MMSSRHDGFTSMVLGAACVVALLVAYVATGLLAPTTVVEGWAGTVSIDGPSEVSAGSGATIMVDTAAQDGATVQLGVFTPVDSTMLISTVEQGMATFAIESQIMRHSGMYRLVAQIDQGVSETHAMRVTPLPAVEPVVPLVGPRTIIADGADISMTVVTPMDRFGNPVADGTPVDIEVGRPTGESALVTELVDRALVAIVIEATTETGRVTISSSVAEADGPSNVVDQVAGIPNPFTVEVDTRDTLADGFALHRIETSELRDRFGNLLPDGVSAVFVIEDSTGTSFLQAVVQGGTARTMLEAPNLPGTTTLSARVGGVESPPTDIEFAPAVASLAATQLLDDSRAIVTIGPVVSERGGYVPDGTPVELRDQNSGDTIAMGALRGGFAEIVLDRDDTVDLEVEVLGASVMVRES